MSGLARRLVEAPPAVRWHLARLRMPVYRAALGSLGVGTVIVRPRILRGTAGIHIGARCAIYEGAWLQCEPGGGPLRIGDDCYLAHEVHLHAIDPVVIGSRVLIGEGALITSTDHGRGDRRAVTGTGPVTIGDDVFIGQRAVIRGGVTIGDRATVGAGAVVTKDVPAGAVAVGIPARVVS